MEAEIDFLNLKKNDKEGRQRGLVDEYMGHLEHMLKNAEKRNIDLEIGTLLFGVAFAWKRPSNLE